MMDAVDQLLRQQRAGFRPERSCMDQIFLLRQIIEKESEDQRPVILNFADFRKAFDSVHRPALWKILEQYGIPSKIISIIQKLYEGSSSVVRIDRYISQRFPVLTGVRQGCILSPLLFAIAIDWVLRRTTKRTTGGITWLEDAHLCDLHFADDIALINEMWVSMQLTTSILEEEPSNVGLFINPDKCKVMTTSTGYDSMDIQAAGMDFEAVSDFCYLSSYISYNGSCENDVRVHTGKAAAVSEKMQGIWKSSKISLRVEMRLYEPVILSTLLYSTDMWLLTATSLKRLDGANHRWQRSTFSVSWKDKITNQKDKTRTKQHSIASTLSERRLLAWSHAANGSPAHSIASTTLGGSRLQ